MGFAPKNIFLLVLLWKLCHRVVCCRDFAYYLLNVLGKEYTWSNKWQCSVLVLWQLRVCTSKVWTEIPELQEELGHSQHSILFKDSPLLAKPQERKGIGKSCKDNRTDWAELYGTSGKAGVGWAPAQGVQWALGQRYPGESFRDVLLWLLLHGSNKYFFDLLSLQQLY